jgi:hypothetical protein
MVSKIDEINKYDVFLTIIRGLGSRQLFFLARLIDREEARKYTNGNEWR